MRLSQVVFIFTVTLILAACEKIKSTIDENKPPENMLNDIISSIETECSENKFMCKNFVVTCSENKGVTPAESQNNIKNIYKINISYIICYQPECENNWQDLDRDISLTVLSDNYAYTESQKNFSFERIYSSEDKCLVKGKQ